MEWIEGVEWSVWSGVGEPEVSNGAQAARCRRARPRCASSYPGRDNSDCYVGVIAFATNFLTPSRVSIRHRLALIALVPYMD